MESPQNNKRTNKKDVTKNVTKSIIEKSLVNPLNVFLKYDTDIYPLVDKDITKERNVTIVLNKLKCP